MGIIFGGNSFAVITRLFYHCVVKILKGNKLVELPADEVLKIIEGFAKIHVDLGCGDGRYVYKQALLNPDVIYFGVDPAIKQTTEYARKANRNKLHNIFFVQGSLEVPPMELKNTANSLSIYLPWGSLLAAVVKPSCETINQIKYFAKPKAEVEIIFGYDAELEPSETKRLMLEQVNKKYIETKIVPTFNENGLILTEDVKELTGADLQKMDLTWGKRISSTIERNYFNIKLKIL